MVGADEVDEVLTHLDNAGWVIATTDEWVATPTTELGTMTEPDFRVVVNLNVDLGKPHTVAQMDVEVAHLVNAARRAIAPSPDQG